MQAERQEELVGYRVDPSYNLEQPHIVGGQLLGDNPKVQFLGRGRDLLAQAEQWPQPVLAVG